jgi:hypothetical protein
MEVWEVRHQRTSKCRGCGLSLAVKKGARGKVQVWGKAGSTP